MKKVFWGVLLAMAGLPTILQLLMLFLLPQLMTGTAAAVSTLLLGLLQALGYYLIMTAAAELPGGNWEWAYKLSKILCAYTVAVAVVQLLPLSLPSAFAIARRTRKEPPSGGSFCRAVFSGFGAFWGKTA